MRTAGVAIALAGLASAYTPAISSVSPNKPHHNPLTSAAPHVEACGIETVTVYETAYGGKGHPAVATPSKGDGHSVKATPIQGSQYNAKPTPSGYKDNYSQYEARPSAKVGKPFGQNGQYFHPNTEQDIKMQPCNHWDFNTKDPKNLVPKGKPQLYYAEGGSDNAKPNNEFYFGVVDLHFKAPAVVLEHSSYINTAKYANNEITVDFSSAYACELAKQSWKKGTIIVSSTAGCRASHEDDQCYFEVDDVSTSNGGKTAVVKGYPQARDKCTEGGEAHWGKYKPDNHPVYGSNSSYSAFPSATRSVPGFYSTTSAPGHPTATPGYISSSVVDSQTLHFYTTKTFGTDGLFTVYTSTAMPSATDGAHPSLSVVSDVHPSATASSDIHISETTNSIMPSATPSAIMGETELNETPKVCQAPIDSKYNLPTACTDEFFDLDLDEIIGYGELSPEDKEFLNQVTDGLHTEASMPQVKRRAERRVRLHRRRSRARRILDWGKRNIVQPVGAALKTGVAVGTAVVKGGIELLTEGTISGGIKKNFDFDLPDGNPADIEQVESPWGKAALIYSIGKPEAVKLANGVQREGYLNVYCVGCGAKGTVELAGSAAWHVTRGITKGEIEAWANLDVGILVGIDAKIKYSKEWKKTMFQKGLPKLSFGPVILGPSVKVEGRVELEAGAEGRVIAGAEMKWNRAYAKVDFYDRTKTQRINFEPVPHPRLEAEGELFVGAELGIPIGLHFGLTVSSWSKTVSLTNEPMVKGIAKAAVQAGLANGKLSAGFKEVDGCKGIHASLNWRNKLSVGLFDIKEFEILDTDYRPIKTTCIPLGKQDPATPPTNEEGGGNGNENPGTGEGNGGGNGDGNGDGNGEGNGDGNGEGNGNGEGEGQGNGDGPGNETPEPNEDNGADNGEPQDGAGGNGGDNGEENAAPVDKKRSLRARQEETEQPADEEGQNNEEQPQVGEEQPQAGENEPAPTEANDTPANNNDDLPEGFEDLTEHVKGGTNNVDYDIAVPEYHPYESADGYVFTKLMAGDYNLIYCSNGNTYLKTLTQAAGLGCDELFILNEHAVVGDGQGGYFYYHEDSMNAAGVSRLRIGDEASAVKGTHSLALAPWTAEEIGEDVDADIQGYYVAADYTLEQLFELVFCVYSDSHAPEVFVVAELEKGMAVLESGDVKYSVTGGDVKKCYPLMVKEDATKTDEWAEWDDSEGVDKDGLDFEF